MTNLPEVSRVLRRFIRRAMATLFEVILPWDCESAESVAGDAFELIEQLERQLTVFDERSEVSRFNRIAGHAAVPLEAGLFELLTTSKRISRATRESFDITTAPLTKAWGFFRRAGSIPDSETLASALKLVGMANLELDESNRRARFSKLGMEINLGSIGKGYALDRVARQIRTRWNQNSFFLNGGTSSVFAAGRWTVGVQHPRERRRLGTLQLADRAMASTGATHQHFEYNGHKFGHVIDPRSGWPAEGTDLALAIAPTAAEADALSTAFFVMGAQGTAEYCAERSEVSAMLLRTGETEPVAFNAEALQWTMSDPDDRYPADSAGDEP